MDNKTTIRLLRKIGACDSAIQWAIHHGGDSATLWRDCERGDWIGWYLGKSPQFNNVPGFYLALAEIIEKQAVPVYKRYNTKEQALKNVVKALRLYSKGKASREDLKDVANAAYAAAYAANAANAASAADAADAAAYAASAAYAADAAAYAANAVKKASLKQSAEIFRKYFPNVD